MVALSPLLGAMALVLRAHLGAPVVFRQVRPGLHGRPFTLLKFRTMEMGTVGDADAARLTGLGAWMRAYAIDELPSLWNVLRGDMSLVGPRPLLMAYLARYTPTQARRHDVRPGLTGLAQVHGRNAVGWDERLAYDVWYVDHRSFRLDLNILLRTVRLLARREGVNAPGHATMPEFQRAA